MVTAYIPHGNWVLCPSSWSPSTTRGIENSTNCT